ncbi:MAG TPA: hypothetical protein VHB77_23380, partial [Planctomycetaceae bacterium]|nr:hypothetical protein [Planctomycetaceae bacterium]
MRSIPQLLLRVRRQASLDVLVVAVWVGVLVAIEIAGRKSPNDFVDGAVLLALATLALMTLVVHSERKLNCVRFVRRILKAPVERVRAALNIEYGIDLRRTPPVPRGGATLWRSMFWGLCIGTVLLVAGSAYCPTALRDVLVPHFYLGYLFLLGGLWGAVLLVGAVCAFVAWGGIHDWLVEQYEGQGLRPVHTEILLSAVMLLVVAGGAIWLPMIVPISIVTGCFGLLTLASVLTNTDLVLLWKHPWNERVYSVDGRWWLWMQAGFLVLVPLDLVLLCRGEALWNSTLVRSHSTMPATVLLGDGLAWLTVAGTLVLTGLYLRTVVLGILLHPRWEPRPTAHVGQDLSADARKALRREFRRVGWNVRFSPNCRRRVDVPVRFASGSQTDDDAEAMIVSVDAFQHPDFLWRLNRRAELHYRRLVVRGLQRLFKRAARRSTDKGH